MNDDRNLGNRYFLWEDHLKYELIYGNKENDGDAGGLKVLANEVVEYYFDDQCILAKTADYTKPPLGYAKYWLINKSINVNVDLTDWRKRVVTGPLDSNSFFKLLKAKKLETSGKWHKLPSR